MPWVYETRLMPNFSIRLRLIFLSVLLLSILAGSSALLIRELVRDSQSLSAEAKLVISSRDEKKILIMANDGRTKRFPTTSLSTLNGYIIHYVC